MIRKFKRKLGHGARPLTQQRQLHAQDPSEDLSAFRSTVFISYVLTEMRDNKHKEEVQLSGIQVLRDRINENPSQNANITGLILAKSGGVTLILTAMKVFPNNLIIHLNAFEILTDLSGTDLPVFDARVLQAVCSSLKNHSRNRNLHAAACAMLSNIARKNPPPFIGDGMEALVSIMAIMQERLDVQQFCLLALDEAAQNRRNWGAFCTPKIFAAILFARIQWGPALGPSLRESTVSMLCLQWTQHLDRKHFLRPNRRLDPGIYRRGKREGLQYSVARTGMFVPAIDRKDGQEMDMIHIMATMEAHKDNWEVQNSALMSLLFYSSRSGPKYCQKVIEAIVSSMIRHASSPIIQTSGCLALTNIFLLNTNFSTTPIVISAIRTLNQHKRDAWARAAALAALAALLAWADEDDNDIQEVLVKQIRRDVLDVMVMADSDWCTKQLVHLILRELLEQYGNPQEGIDVPAVIENSIAVLRSPKATVAAQVSALGLLNAVVQHDANIEAFLRTAGVAAVTALMIREGEIQPDFDRLGLRVLQTVMQGRFTSRAVDQKRSIEALVVALNRDLCQEEKLILNALASLILKSMLCTLDFLEAPGGIDTIISITRTRKADFMIHFPCFHILYRVAFYATLDELEEAVLCAVDKVITLMNEHQLRGDHLEMCCVVLNWVLKSRPKSRRSIAQGGGIEALAWALKKKGNSSHGYASMNAMEALVAMSTAKAYHLQMATSGAVDEIIAVLRHSQDGSIREKGFEVLRNVSQSPITAMAILRGGGIFTFWCAWVQDWDTTNARQYIPFISLQLLKAIYWHAWLWRLQLLWGQ